MLAVSSSERPKVIAKRRRGTGDALACGFDTATGDITMIDADGSPIRTRSPISSRRCFRSGLRERHAILARGPSSNIIRVAVA